MFAFPNHHTPQRQGHDSTSGTTPTGIHRRRVHDRIGDVDDGYMTTAGTLTTGSRPQWGYRQRVHGSCGDPMAGMPMTGTHHDGRDDDYGYTTTAGMSMALET
jgi:hypothetical protein